MPPLIGRDEQTTSVGRYVKILCETRFTWPLLRNVADAGGGQHGQLPTEGHPLDNIPYSTLWCSLVA